MVECSDASGGTSGDASQEGESTGCEDGGSTYAASSDKPNICLQNESFGYHLNVTHGTI